MRRQITAPVVKITDAAAAFEDARFEPESLASVRSRTDELGDLARTFTRMAAEVQARTDTLDRLVAERTRELNEKNALLEAANHRMDAELAIARTLQAAMMPQRCRRTRAIPARRRWCRPARWAATSTTSSRVGENRVGLVIADVSGKGVPAAFFMAISRTILQGSARERRTAGTCLADTNDLLCQQNPLDLFVTAFYGILDLDTGELSYANAGHNPPLLGPRRRDRVPASRHRRDRDGRDAGPGLCGGPRDARRGRHAAPLYRRHLRGDGPRRARVHRGAADRLAVARATASRWRSSCRR